MDGGPSTTAMMVAVARGLYRTEVDPPWVLDDPFGMLLLGPAGPQIEARIRPLLRPELFREVITGIALRSRYAEDGLVRGGFAQHVILGAGLDSFAWRRPDLLRRTRVFEVDHPATQAWKVERLAALSLPVGAGPVFVPVDFERDSLQAALAAAGLDWSLPTFFSWLGVLMYLPDEAVEATLKALAAAAPGSEIALSYLAAPEEMDGNGRETYPVLRSVTAAVGEPVTPGRAAEDVVRLIEKCGLRVVDHPDPQDILDRYFAGTDQRPWTVERLLVARV